MKTILVIPDLKFKNNVYSSIRSAEAFGVTELILIGEHKLDGYGFNKVTKGAYKHLNIKRFANEEECLNYLIRNRIKIICIENSTDAFSLKGFKFPANVAFIMGHECLGVPDIFRERFINLKIPQYGLMFCLNTSVAMSIVLYERFSQALKV